MSQNYIEKILRAKVYDVAIETPLDFVPYLGRPRDELLRGELVGDVRNVQSPIYLGVWSALMLVRAPSRRAE